MTLDIPSDISAETLDSYLGDIARSFSFCGSHKRNAYKDILSLSGEDGIVKVEMARAGLYDILPEALFHPIDRFGNIPTNEYKERFAEEVELQQKEESDARKFFEVFDRFIFGLECEISRLKQNEYSGNTIISDIICDTLDMRYKTNRFVRRLIEFTPQCHRIRGDKTLITLILRKILSDEGLALDICHNTRELHDIVPEYACSIGSGNASGQDTYLGNKYEECVTEFEIKYWDEDACGETFPEFVDEIKCLEDFINDYFVGIETAVRFNLTTIASAAELSVGPLYNYLDYNTNL